MKIKRFTSCDCINILPKVLIEYIWDLAITNKSEEQKFILQIKNTGCGSIQEVYHLSNSGNIIKKVFGFTPIEAVAEVYINGENCFMSIEENSILYSAWKAI